MSQNVLHYVNEMGFVTTGIMEVLLNTEGLNRMIPFLINTCHSYVLYNEFCGL